MREASRIYESGETLFVETGSTTGIQAMLASVAGPDSFFLLPRSVHMSVLHTLALLGTEYAL
jgi:arginine/lysine/ornithine decarboxylase